MKREMGISPAALFPAAMTSGSTEIVNFFLLMGIPGKIWSTYLYVPLLHMQYLMLHFLKTGVDAQFVSVELCNGSLEAHRYDG